MNFRSVSFRLKRVLPPVAMAAWALAPHTASATTPIRSLPATLNTAGETYVFESDLTFSGSGAAITISASGVTLDGGGKTLRYCDTSGDCKGITLNGASNTTIKNLTLQQGSAATGIATAIGGTSGSGAIIDGVRFNLVARPGGYTYGSSVMASGTGNEIRNSSFYITGNDSMESINNASSAAWSVHNNTWNVTNLQMTSTYARLINVGNSSQYYNNNITVDGQSRYVNVFVSWAQASVKIYGNRINYASHHGRIFHLDDSSSGFEISDNQVTVTSQNVNDETVYVFRLRSDAGHKGSSNHSIHHNTVDASQSTTVLGISIGADTYANDNNTFSYNSITTPYVPLDFYGDYASNTSFFCNNFNHTGKDAYAIMVLGGLHRNLRFENNTVTTARADGLKVRFNANQSYASTWEFANTGILSTQISGLSAVTGLLLQTVTSLGTSGCASSAGARSVVSAPTTPIAPSLLVK